MIDIRPATADDLPRIEEIYDAIHTAEETGAASVGWARGVYPTRATAQAALDDGALFVLEDDGVLVAAGRIDQVQVPVYAQVPWQYTAPPEQVLVLHTLVVDPTIARHGYGTQFVRFYARRAHAAGSSAGQRATYGYQPAITSRPGKSAAQSDARPVPPRCARSAA